jgi:hypothetical protein
MMKLIHEASGEPIAVGDELQSVAGKTAKVLRIVEPTDGVEEGRVYTDQGEHVPGAYGCIFVSDD